jgi:hypothetical protein
VPSGEIAHLTRATENSRHGLREFRTALLIAVHNEPNMVFEDFHSPPYLLQPLRGKFRTVFLTNRYGDSGDFKMRLFGSQPTHPMV